MGNFFKRKVLLSTYAVGAIHRLCRETPRRTLVTFSRRTDCLAPFGQDRSLALMGLAARTGCETA
jgi:hypothetical protein